MVTMSKLVVDIGSASSAAKPAFIGDEFCATPLLAIDGKAKINDFKCLLEGYSISRTEVAEPIKSLIGYNVEGSHPVFTQTLNACASNNGTLVVAGDGPNNNKVFVSLDGGSFSSINLPDTNWANRQDTIDVSPNGQNILLGSHGKVIYSKDRASSFNSTNLSTSDVVYALKFLTDSIAVAFTYNSGSRSSKIWRSTNAGENWTLIKNLPTGYQANYLSFNGPITFLSRAGQGSDGYISTDQGITWSAIANKTSVRFIGNDTWVAFNGSNPSEVSVDNCSTWEAYTGQLVSPNIVTDYSGLVIELVDNGVHLLVYTSRDHGATKRQSSVIATPIIKGLSLDTHRMEVYVSGNYAVSTAEQPFVVLSDKLQVTPSSDGNRWLAYARAT